MIPRPYTLLAPETPTERAHRLYHAHIARCVRFRRGGACPRCERLDRGLTEAASGDLPWPVCSETVPTGDAS